jgi:hypothetical protein
MNKNVNSIVQNADSTVSFSFLSSSAPIIVNTSDTIFHETFDKCNGKGGNDGIWSGSSAARGAFVPDVSGWIDNFKYGAYKCAKFNTTTDRNIIVSPSFVTKGATIITLSIAPWGTDSTTTINVSIGDNLVIATKLTPNQWNKFEFQYTGSGTTYLKILANRLFIDDVMVTKDSSTGIQSIGTEASRKSDNRIYTLSGQYVGTDFSVVSKGIYIMNGKKIVKK